jgi:hypothetical protein
MATIRGVATDAKYCMVRIGKKERGVFKVKVGYQTCIFRIRDSENLQDAQGKTIIVSGHLKDDGLWVYYWYPLPSGPLMQTGMASSVPSWLIIVLVLAAMGAYLLKVDYPIVIIIAVIAAGCAVGAWQASSYKSEISKETKEIEESQKQARLREKMGMK